MYGCMDGGFARAGRGKGPIYTYIHGPMPFQRTTKFPCILTFRRAEWAKGQLALTEACGGQGFLTTITTHIQKQLYSTSIPTYQLSFRQFAFCTT